MAVIVKYVVVRDGKEEMIFSTKQEAEAHDKMLAIAERLYTLLHETEITIADDSLEALTLYMAQHREHISTILKGGKPQTPAVRAPHASVPPAKRETAPAPEHRRSKASASAPPTPPQAAA